MHAGDANGGIVVIPDAFTSAHRAEVASLTNRHRVSAIYVVPFLSKKFGGLISYGPFLVDGTAARLSPRPHPQGREAGPASRLPDAPVGTELVINLKAARAFGLTVPDKLRSLADDVIEGTEMSIHPPDTSNAPSLYSSAAPTRTSESA